MSQKVTPLDNMFSNLQHFFVFYFSSITSSYFVVKIYNNEKVHLRLFFLFIIVNLHLFLPSFDVINFDLKNISLSIFTGNSPFIAHIIFIIVIPLCWKIYFRRFANKITIRQIGFWY